MRPLADASRASLISRHFLGYPSEWLSQTFAWQTWGNGLVAIIAGVAANIVADAFGLVAPFMLALLCFAGCAAVAASAWSENYGQATSVRAMAVLTRRAAAVAHRLGGRSIHRH